MIAEWEKVNKKRFVFPKEQMQLLKEELKKGFEGVNRHEDGTPTYSWEPTKIYYLTDGLKKEIINYMQKYVAK